MSCTKGTILSVFLGEVTLKYQLYAYIFGKIKYFLYLCTLETKSDVD